MAAILLAAALCLKVLVPSGFMPAQADNGIVVAICSGTMGQSASVKIRIPGQDSSRDHQQSTADHPCAFAPLCAAMLAADLVPLIAAALAFAFVAAILHRPLLLREGAPRYRPPGQGPPILI